VTTSDQLKESLRRVFDTQIPNYGDYNLVYASNASALQGVLQAPLARVWPGKGRESKLRCFVVGYRWKPMEIVVAPFHQVALTAAAVPVTFNMTNLHQAVQLPGGDIEISTSTGKAFRFGVQPLGELPPLGDQPGVRRVIEQPGDHEDYAAFLASFLSMV
jgi:hypothetical protein